MPQVLCLGEMLLDRLANDIGVPYEVVQNWTDYPGGAPANVACALQRLGTSSAFLGCIGSDPEGDRLCSTLQHYGVDIQGVQRHPSAPTRQIYVTRSKQGDRNFAGFGGRRTQDFADTQYEIAALPSSLFESATHFVMGTLMLAIPPARETAIAALNLAKQNQMCCFMDVNWRPMFWPHPIESDAVIHQILPSIDYLKLSETEAQQFFGTEHPETIAQAYPHLQGVFITHGSRGCQYWLECITGSVPAFHVNAVDTTGAGDAFVAGCIHQLYQQGTPKNEVQAHSLVAYASAVGALTTVQAGAIADHPTAVDVAAFLQTTTNFTTQ